MFWKVEWASVRPLPSFVPRTWNGGFILPNLISVRCDDSCRMDSPAFSSVDLEEIIPPSCLRKPPRRDRKAPCPICWSGSAMVRNDPLIHHFVEVNHSNLESLAFDANVHRAGTRGKPGNVYISAPYISTQNNGRECQASWLSGMLTEVIGLLFTIYNRADRHIRRALTKLTEVAQGWQLCLYICKFVHPQPPLPKRVFSLLRFRNPVLPSCSSKPMTDQTETVRFIAHDP
ncbi:hypothetical protein QR685DRAFT_4895 [Neurospora intermedia]|uniref:Uncharacterized protein n=1 Tax=Neurospora intermedia TaxID=5142 RepID=A0ABR3DNR1_NEUIN